MGVRMTSSTAMTILATQNRKLMRPMLAPWPHGSHTLVPSADMTSTTRMMMACAVPLLWPQPIVTPNAMFVANKRQANSCDPCL